MGSTLETLVCTLVELVGAVGRSNTYSDVISVAVLIAEQG